MEETRRYNIEKRVFKKSDIKLIGKIFLDEYEKVQYEEKYYSSITFRLDCDDNTSYESKDMGLFDDGNIIDIKRTRTVEITFQDYKLSRYINISIIHGQSYRNTLIVNGKDQDWVNGIFIRIKEIIDSTTPQEKWIIRHKTFLLHLSALGVGIIMHTILWILIYQHIEPTKDPSDNFFVTYPLSKYVFNLLIIWGTGLFGAFYLRNWLLSLWPIIEFDFGPEHLKIENSRRKRISVFIIIAVIPIVLTVGYDLVKSILMK